MAITKTVNSLTEEEYLKAESKSEHRHEYINGDVRMMAGAKAAHNLITGNIFAEIRSQLKGSDCKIFSSDMKVKVRSQYSMKQ